MIDDTDLVEILSRRHDMLRALDERPRTRRELADDLDDDNSTVSEGVSQLLEVGVIEQTDDGLAPTLFGSVALGRYDELIGTADLGGLLADLPADAVDPSVFVDAELVVPQSGAADRHRQRAREHLDAATVVRGVVPAASAETVVTVGDRLATDRFTAEFVLTTDVVETLRATHPGAIDRIVDAGGTLWQIDESVPFGWYVLREPTTAHVAIEFRDGSLVTGLLLNDTAESIRWGQEQFRAYRERATRLQQS